MKNIIKIIGKSLLSGFFFILGIVITSFVIIYASNQITKVENGETLTSNTLNNIIDELNNLSNWINNEGAKKSEIVNLTDNQTIGGIKTFNNNIVTNANIIEKYGLGSKSGKIPPGNDLNEAREIGFWSANIETLNKPSGSASYGSVITTNLISNTRSQIFMNAQPGQQPRMWIRVSATWSDDNQWGNWIKIISENTNGNVGIGTTAPTRKLEVSGDMRIKHDAIINCSECLHTNPNEYGRVCKYRNINSIPNSINGTNIYMLGICH